MDHQLPPYAVVVTVGQGRGLRATRDIEKNEIVLIDEPFVMGPFTVSSPLCLSCNARPLTSSSTTLTKCPGLCGFWLCCQKCCSKDQNFWHAMYECPLLSNAIENGNLKPPVIKELARPHPAYSIVTTLRLLLKEDNLATSDPFAINLLEHHCDKRQREDSQTWKLHEHFVVKPILQVMDEFEERYIRETIGRLLVNTLTIGDDSDIMGLYPKYALLNHSCRHNTRVIKFPANDGFRIHVVARTRIAKGEPITTRYIPYTQGTVARRQALYDKWYFNCTCQLCSDPTEGGSYFSGVACEKCHNGYLLPVINSDQPTWQCHHCDDDSQEVDEIIKFMNLMAIKATEANSFTILQKTVDTLKAKLHPNHYILVRLEQKMARIMSADKALLRKEKVAICQHVIAVRSFHEHDPQAMPWYKTLVNEMIK